MKQSFDNFILAISYPLLRKVLYIYVGAVVFWDSAPMVSLWLWIVILITLIIIGYQSQIRKARLIGRNPSSKTIYMETMRAPVRYWLPRLIATVAAGILAGYLLNGQFGLNVAQICMLTTGYVFLYRETRLLGNYVAYLVSDSGIGIELITGHQAYQTFAKFSEIKSVNVIDGQEPSRTWSFLTPLGSERSGLLLMPANPNGFSPHEYSFFITPKDVQSFLSHLPNTMKVIESN